MITSQVSVQFPLQVGSPRSEGIHLSKVIRAIAVESKILDANYAEDLSLFEVSGRQVDWWASLNESVRLKMSMGLAWEDWYVPHLQTVAYHPGEMDVEGIYMTHDGESLDVVWGGDLALHEVKLTYKSTKTVGNLETQWMWLAQCKGYCKGLNTRTAYLHVLFVCGDYKYPITPQLKVWKIQFTQEEIDDNWELLIDYVRHRRVLEQEDEGLEGL